MSSSSNWKIKKLFIFYLIIFIEIFTNQIDNELIFIDAKKNGSLSVEFLSMLKKCFHVEVFVETGTYLGETSINAANFFDVHTIELDKALFQRAKNLIKRYNLHNVKQYQGDSKKILNEILPTINKKILFFLDAHWSEGWTAKGEENTPILHELSCIQKSGIKNAVILIDDLRFFCNEELLKKENQKSCIGYPTINELYKKILDIDSNYTFIVYGDIGIAYSKSDKVNISKIIKAMTISRTNHINSIDESILEAEQIIKNATDVEKKALLNLSKFIEVNPYLTINYRLWYALILLKEKNLRSTYEFSELTKLGVNKKKIDLYNISI